MPRYVQNTSTDGLYTETVLAICYQALKNLQWEILLAGQDTLIGHTPKSWKSKGQQINCSVSNDTLVVISETVNVDFPNSTAINQNNTNTFLNAYATAKKTTDEGTIMANLQAIYELRNVSQKAIAQQKEEFEELDKAMNLSGSNLYFTYAIIGINVLVFLLMALDGAGIFEPNGLVHLRWGSNFAPLTLSGDWWRLITNVFLHFGVIHITMNMYCLYSIATYIEPMLGKSKYITAYLCTGVLASLTSLWWHTDPANSAGASGAVFGVYGLFLAFLTTNLIPQSIRKSLLQSIGVFVVFNLVYGLKSGVDNAAHIGGLVSGFVIGYAYVFAIKKEKEQKQNIGWLLPVIVLLTAGITITYLQQHKVGNNTRVQLQNELKESSYKDHKLFYKHLADFDAIHNMAMQTMADTTVAGDKKIDNLRYVVLPKWEQARQLILPTTSYEISPAAHHKATGLLDYISLRKRETEILIEMATTTQANNLATELAECRAKASVVFAVISKE